MKKNKAHIKKSVRRIRKRYRSDYQFKTYLSSTWSVLIGIGFSLFNGVLAILHHALWNGTISVYYMLLAIIRGIIVFSAASNTSDSYGKVRMICIRTHVLMIFLDLCLIAPIAYMVMGERNYSFGLIPTIAMAAYTTYRITMSSLQYRTSRKHGNLLVKELRVINLQDALVAVLSLQNALIIATGSSAASMLALTGWTSAAIWVVIVLLTVKSFLNIKHAGHAGACSGGHDDSPLPTDKSNENRDATVKQDLLS